MSFNTTIYLVFSFITMFAYFKNFWNEDVDFQDIMVYLVIHITMCLIFIKVFWV